MNGMYAILQQYGIKLLCRLLLCSTTAVLLPLFCCMHFWFVVHVCCCCEPISHRRRDSAVESNCSPPSQIHSSLMRYISVSPYCNDHSKLPQIPYALFLVSWILCFARRSTISQKHVNYPYCTFHYIIMVQYYSSIMYCRASFLGCYIIPATGAC